MSLLDFRIIRPLRVDGLPGVPWRPPSTLSWLVFMGSAKASSEVEDVFLQIEPPFDLSMTWDLGSSATPLMVVGLQRPKSIAVDYRVRQAFDMEDPGYRGTQQRAAQRI